MREHEENVIFSERNLMLLGILDEAYDLYLKCCDSAEAELERKKVERPSVRWWPTQYTPFCKKEIGK